MYRFRKKTFLISVIFLLLSAGISYAAPTYGPDMPEKGNWHMGFEANIVRDRHMSKNLGDAKSDQIFFSESYGIYDWLSFDGKIGLGYVKFAPRETRALDLDPGFSGGYGLRFRTYYNEFSEIRAVLGFHHISVHPHKDEVGSMRYYAVWDEWQASLLLSKRFKRWHPYVGAKVSQLFIIRKDNVDDHWRWNGSDDHFGIFTGMNAELFDDWYVNIEGRFIDETAINLSINYKL